MDKDEQREKKKITDETEVSVAELSVVLGKTPDRIYQLVRDGTLQTTRRGHLLLADSVHRYIRFLSKDAVAEEDVKLDRMRRQSEVTMKASKAQIAKLEMQELQGKMHRSEDVAALTEDLIYTVRGTLMALPGRLAVDVAAASTAAEAAEIIRKEVHKAMRELSAYQYDPKKYEERVRERRDWETVSGRDGDDE